MTNKKISIKIPHIQFIACNTIQWGDITGNINNQQDLYNFVMDNIGDIVTTTVNNIVNDISTINNKISIIQGDITDIINNYDYLNNAYNWCLDNIFILQGKTQNMQLDITNINNEITNINTSISNLDNRVTTIEGDITNIQGDIITLQTDVSNIQTDITNIQGDVFDLQTEITNINSEITNINTAITNLENRVTTIEGDIVNIQGDVSTLQTDVTNIQGDIVTIQNDITTIQTDISNIQTDVSDIQNDISLLKMFEQSVCEWAKNPQVIRTNEDLNTLKSNGIYICNGSNANAPMSFIASLIVIASSTFIYQFWFSSNRVYMRLYNNTWTPWSYMLTQIHEDVFNNKIDNLQTQINSKANSSSITNIQGDINAINYKLSGIEDGAQVNVQSDWNQTDTTADDYILNKPNNLASSWGTITGLLSNQTDLQQEIDAIYTAISNMLIASTKIGSQVLQAIAEDTTYTNTTRLVQGNINPGDGSLSTTNLDLVLASASKSGIMPKEAYQQIATNTTDISILSGVGQRYPVSVALPDMLTSLQLDTIYQSVSGNNTPNEMDALISFHPSTLNYEWVYFTSISDWYFRGVTAVNIASQTVAGIVKGDVTDGKVYVELNGTMSLNGYDDIVNDITDIQTDITNIEGNISNINTNISTINNNITDLQLAQGVKTHIIEITGYQNPYGGTIGTLTMYNGIINQYDELLCIAQLDIPPVGDWGNGNTYTMIRIQDNEKLIQGYLGLVNPIANGQAFKCYWDGSFSHNDGITDWHIGNLKMGIENLLGMFYDGFYIDVNSKQVTTIGALSRYFEQNIGNWAGMGLLQVNPTNFLSNIDTVWQNGIYFANANAVTLPFGENQMFLLIHTQSVPSFQIIFGLDTPVCYIRKDIAAVWQPWQKIGSDINLSNIETNITNIETDITNIETDITNIQGDITNIQSDITTIEGDISNIQNDITNIETDITALDNRVTNVEGDITTINTKLNGVETGAQKNVQSDWNQTNTSTDDYIKNKPDFVSLEGRVTTIEGDIVTLDLGIIDLQTDLGTTNTNVSNLIGRVTNVEGDITTIQSDISNIQNDITNIEGDITSLDGRLTTAEGNITTINTNLSGLTGGTQLSSGIYKITTNARGIVTAGSAVNSSDIASLGVAITDTVTSVSQTGSGNAITSISGSGASVVATKGLTFVTDDRIQLVNSLPPSPVSNVLYLIPE